MRCSGQALVGLSIGCHAGQQAHALIAHRHASAPTPPPRYLQSSPPSTRPRACCASSLAVPFQLITLPASPPFNTAVIPSLNIAAGLLGFFLLKSWAKGMDWAKLPVRMNPPLTAQEVTVIQVRPAAGCLGSCPAYQCMQLAPCNVVVRLAGAEPRSGAHVWAYLGRTPTHLPMLPLSVPSCHSHLHLPNHRPRAWRATAWPSTPALARTYWLWTTSHT